MTVICLHGERFNVFRVQQTTGVVTGHTADTVTDSAKSWTPDEWQDHAVRFTSGNHDGRSYNIISNTADTLTCTIPLGSSVSGENIGTGDGGTKIFSGTLADPVDTGTLSITDTVETFSDPLNDGTLVGDQGGSGTITYTTGAWSVTFNTAPAGGQAITADYDPVFNFNCDGGLANGNTFEIIEQCKDLVQNATPPGSADLTDQAVSTIAVKENEGFYLYLDTTGGATFTVTALVGDGVEDNTESWTTDEWIGSRIAFTSGALSGQSFAISSNTDDDILSKGISFSAAGVLVNDTFVITHTFFREVLNTTPGGSADLSDQPIIGTIEIKDEGFCLYLDTLAGATFTVTALVDGGVEDDTQSWSANEWVGYKIEFTSGALSGNSYLIAQNTSDDIHGQGVNFSDDGVLAGDTFKIVPFFFRLVEDATPGGDADLSDQAVVPVAAINGEGFYIFVSPYGAPATIYEISSFVDGGLKVADIGWLDNVFAVGYRIEFTDGALSGQSFVVSSNTNEEMHSAGIDFSDEGVLAGDHFKLTLDYIDLLEKKWLVLRHHRFTGGLTHHPTR